VLREDRAAPGIGRLHERGAVRPFRILSSAVFEAILRVSAEESPQHREGATLAVDFRAEEISGNANVWKRELTRPINSCY
jgi:hypothetical protein